MSTQFWMGMLTLPITAITIAAVVAAYSVATKAWQKLHSAIASRVEVAPNRYRLRLKGDPPDERHEYEDGANKIRDALLRSPRFFTINGLGWYVILVKDKYKPIEKQKP